MSYIGNSTPGWIFGYTPTSTEWSNGFSGKQDYDPALTSVVVGAMRWGVLPLSAGAPTVGGTGHAVGDVITLTGGAKVSVITVSGGVVTQFYVQQSGSYTTVPSGAIAQTATTGTGTGLTITPAFGPIAASIGAASLSPGQGNFILGYQAGNSITTGVEVTAVGDYAGLQLTTGGYNTAFGHRAMGFETTGTNNAAFGLDCMRNTRGLVTSQAFGANALRSWNASYSTAIGANALMGNDDGSSVGGINIAIGVAALQGVTATSAANNIGIGNNVAYAITTGANNTILGHQAGGALTTGLTNILLGNLAGASLVSAYENIFVGYGAGYVATSNSGTAIGHLAGTAITSGGANTLYGNRAGSKITTGGGNTIIGYQVASTTLTTGSNNIIIGVNAFADAAAAGSVDTLIIQGNGTTPAISGTGLNSATPQISIPGILSAGRFASSHFTANGSVATALSSIGPTGSHATVQEWFTVVNASGVTRYIPAF